jgi:hypothetical protein
VLERGNERNPDDGERGCHDDGEREAQLRADAPEGVHPAKR